MLVGDLGDGLDVGHVQRRVADGLAKNSAGLVVDGLVEVLRVVGVDEARVMPSCGQDRVELGVGAAVEVVGRDDLVPGLARLMIE